MLSKAFSKVSKHMGKYKKYHFFLFSDVLIYAEEIYSKLGQKRYKMKHVLSVDSIMVVKDTEKLNNRIKVLITKQKRPDDKFKSCEFLLKAANTLERDGWYQDLDKAIKEQKVAPLEVQNFDGRKGGDMTMKSSKMAALLGMDQ